MDDAVNVVDEVLAAAVRAQASDVYWIPAGTGMDIRFRVNGDQQPFRTLDRDLGTRCVARLKVLSGLLTYQTRTSQDGVLRGREADASQPECRVSVMPTQFGERVSLRFMLRQADRLHLEDLRLGDDVVAALRRMLSRESGMILLTGPTGCGKTTTIYAMIRELLRNGMDPASILTIEDPIECVVPGITQSAVRPDWQYADALKAALRQDVKTLIIGELRDPEVVRVTLDAALTGHRVITTYHAGDIAGVYARLMHSGFEPFLIAAAVTGVVAQRLVKQADGNRQPIAAVLEPDDAWRDTVCTADGLQGLRTALSDRPEADLESLLNVPT